MGSSILSFLSPALGLLGAMKGGKAPKVDTAPAAATAEAQRKAKDSRSALIMNQGGQAGSELDPSQVQKRNTLLGN